jgi:hypothetical protein
MLEPIVMTLDMHIMSPEAIITANCRGNNLNIAWMLEPIVMKLDMHIMSPEDIITANFINHLISDTKTAASQIFKAINGKVIPVTGRGGQH